MLIRLRPEHPILPSEITDEAQWRQRRRQWLGAGVAGTGLLLAGCTESASAAAAPAAAPAAPPAAGGTPTGAELSISRRVNLAGEETPNGWDDVTTYNNYYEFGTAKSDPAENAGTLETRPWTVKVDGECEAPATLDLDALLKPHALEERICRLRCVEAWSMVVPWVGFSLGDLLKRFKPTSKAKFVQFHTLADRRQMPLIEWGTLPFPYREGLRIDEAMHPLAMLAVGVYGRVLPNQNGAPLRLVLPWKYGFKSIKSIVAIRFTETQPETTWNKVLPREYGFYANVNPAVDHPRWSQARERRLGELFKRPTLPFNGYPEVAKLYAGMDLAKYY